MVLCPLAVELGETRFVDLLLPVAILRFNQGRYYFVSPDVKPLPNGHLLQLQIDDFISTVKTILKGSLPDGYYYYDFESKKGDYLETDEFDKAVYYLAEMGYLNLTLEE